MLISRRKMVAAALSAAVAGWLVVTPAGAGNDGGNAVKLEGAWIARGVEAPLQWTYVLSPDPSGRQASLHGSIDVGLGGNPFDADYASPLIGNLVLTGPHTARFNSAWYGIKKLPPAAPLSAQIVYIGMNSGEASFVDGQWEVTHHIAYYPPSSDADGDGLPDPGSAPAVGPITVHTVDTRLPLPH